MIEGDKEVKNLVFRAKNGESEAFGLIYDMFLPQIYRFILFKTGGNKEEAEDIAQQVFINAWENLANFEEGKAYFSGWLFKIAKNKIIDFYRLRKNHESIDDYVNFLIEEESEAEKKITSLDDKKILNLALNQLSDEQKEIIILRFVEEMSFGEIAQILNKNQNTVRIIQFRALSRLKRFLEKNGR